MTLCGVVLIIYRERLADALVNAILTVALPALRSTAIQLSPRGRRPS